MLNNQMVICEIASKLIPAGEHLPNFAAWKHPSHLCGSKWLCPFGISQHRWTNGTSPVSWIYIHGYPLVN